MKKNIPIFFFLSEVVIILLFHFFGTQGLPLLWKLKQENLLISQEIVILQQEVNALENKCIEWQKYPFYKEKIAREQLQMAREDDYIFYITN